MMLHKKNVRDLDFIRASVTTRSVGGCDCFKFLVINFYPCLKLKERYYEMELKKDHNNSTIQLHDDNGQ